MVRVRNRYIIGEIIWDTMVNEDFDSRSYKSDQNFSKEVLSKAVKEAITLNYGEFGAARILSNFRGNFSYVIFACSQLFWIFTSLKISERSSIP